MNTLEIYSFRKRAVLIALLLTSISLLLFSRQVIENPDKPLNEAAGRVLRLTEVMRITDTDQKYYFANPFDILIDSYGFIYFQESNKLYVFDSNGKYVRNLYKKGEGPGELNDNLSDVILQGDEVILFSSNMNKIIRMGREGTLLEEVRPKILFYNLVGYYKGKYFLTDLERTQYERKSQLREEDLVLYAVDSDGEAHPTPLRFPITIAYHFGERGAGIMSVSRLKTRHDTPRFKYLIHSPEYMVKVLDLEKVEIVRRFRRAYKRLEYTKKWKSRLYTMVQPQYQNDVYCVLLHGDDVWIVTSSYDGEKGLLVDVFNRKGEYIDNFYLPLIGVKKDDHIYAPMTVFEDFLFVIRQDEEGLYSIVKYKIPSKVKRGRSSRYHPIIKFFTNCLIPGFRDCQVETLLKAPSHALIFPWARDSEKARSENRKPNGNLHFWISTKC